MYYEQQALKFECTGCGNCCTGRGDYYVETSPAEQRRIQKFLGISWRWFQRRYLHRYDDGVESLAWDHGRQRCVFLDAEYRCRIYSVRPTQCRTYPFWPEVVDRQKTWKAEVKRCEGIGRGGVVPLEHIRKLLKQQRSSG